MPVTSWADMWSLECLGRFHFGKGVLTAARIQMTGYLPLSSRRLALLKFRRCFDFAGLLNYLFGWGLSLQLILKNFILKSKVLPVFFSNCFFIIACFFYVHTINISTAAQPLAISGYGWLLTKEKGRPAPPKTDRPHPKELQRPFIMVKDYIGYLWIYFNQTG